MARARTLLGAATLGWALLAVGPGATDAGERHAGAVLAVDPRAWTLTIDEFGANGVRRARRVQVPRDALVLLSQRNGSAREAKDTFRDHGVGLAEVRPGDFVVIELSGDPDVARLIMITLRRGAGS